MPSQRRVLAGVVLVVSSLGFAAGARADGPTRSIPANINDPEITTERGENLVWLPAPERRVGKLLVFLPTGGATNLPTEFLHLGTEMGRLGYHTIVLAYRNEAPIAALPTAPVPGCGPDELASDAAPTCARDARMEILKGRNSSAVVNIDRANSIENRLNKVLVHLAATYPAEQWGKFIDTSGSEPQPKWPETVIAGSSLGAGEAAMIAAEHEVPRAVLLHGWVDARHGWVTLGATPSSKYFTLIHQRDNFFARSCYAYLALGLTPSCPLAAFPPIAPPSCPAGFPTLPANPLWVENRTPPYGIQLHVFNLRPGSFAGMGDWCHQSTSRDGWIAKEPDGTTPSKVLVSAWRSVLGDSDADTYLDEADTCPLVPNADQTDSDRNGVGDACGPTFAAGAAGGSVAPTLALALGPPASFGAFTAGVDRTYDATTTATVISTAGDAALTVADPGTNATGRLVNGAFSLAEPLRANAVGAFASVSGAPLALHAYTGPVSNDALTIAFRQHIGPTEALRTGAYGKTLTFTLSTASP
jgi:hypothetical protein